MLGFIRVGFCFSTQTPDWFRKESLKKKKKTETKGKKKKKKKKRKLGVEARKITGSQTEEDLECQSKHL